MPRAPYLANTSENSRILKSYSLPATFVPFPELLAKTLALRNPALIYPSRGPLIRMTSRFSPHFGPTYTI